MLELMHSQDFQKTVTLTLSWRLLKFTFLVDTPLVSVSKCYAASFLSYCLHKQVGVRAACPPARWVMNTANQPYKAEG